MSKPLKYKLNQYQIPRSNHPGTSFFENGVGYPQVCSCSHLNYFSACIYSLLIPNLVLWSQGGQNALSYSFTYFDNLAIRL